MQGAFNLIGLLLGLSALFGWINARWLRLPRTIGMVVIALVVSLGIIAADFVLPGWGLKATALGLLDAVDFPDTLMKGVLSFLLFAGALHVNLSDLLDRKWAVLLLATLGVVIATALIGGAMYYVFRLLGLEVPLIYCLVFGALIAPTDPVAVLGILKRVHVPPSLEAKIAGESLLNDGVGVVVFSVLLTVASGVEAGAEFGVSAVAILFAEEVGGGLALGLAAGGIAFYMLRAVDDYVVEVLITLALVAGTYGIAQVLHVSGPLAVVVAGLLVGNQGARLAMSETTREHLLNFWSLTDEILNALLFLLIGFEALAVAEATRFFPFVALVIPVVLVARLASVALPLGLLRGLAHDFTPGAVWVLTWGGLRGGISVALALSLPATPWTGAILVLCFGVVIFSVVVQGLTMERLIRRVVPPGN